MTVTSNADTVVVVRDEPVVAAPRRSLLARLAPGTANPWAGRLVLLAIGLVLSMGPEMIGSPARVLQWSQYLCFATIAIGLDVAWGYGGMLALGQGVFFGLGAYAMGMYLSLEQVPDGAMPKFMSLYSDYEELPAVWRPFKHLWFAAPAAVIVPMLVAGALGWLVFRRRIRGPYFALLTQAMALIFVLLLVGQLKLTAGTNGLTDFATVFGRNRYDPDTSHFLFYLAAIGLFAALLVGRHLVRSRYGRLLVATRDAEDRVRFLGYDPAVTKTVAYMVAAGMAGLAGALAAPIIGIVAPQQFAVVPSILMITWVAIGGRGTLYGAAIGAILVNWGETRFSEARPEDWEYLRGFLFIVVIAYIPGGLAGIARAIPRLGDVLRGRREPAEVVEALEATT